MVYKANFILQFFLLLFLLTFFQPGHGIDLPVSMRFGNCAERFPGFLCPNRLVSVALCSKDLTDLVSRCICYAFASEAIYITKNRDKFGRGLTWRINEQRRVKDACKKMYPGGTRGMRWACVNGKYIFPNGQLRRCELTRDVRTIARSCNGCPKNA